MNHEIKEPIGSLRISKDVLATIAANATKEIEGVAGIAPFTTNIKNWITKKQSAVPVPVFISLHDDIAVIDINVVLLEGANIPAVCRNIQVAVKEAVQSMTSINVSKVNVTVADIRFHGERVRIPLIDQLIPALRSFLIGGHLLCENTLRIITV